MDADIREYQIGISDWISDLCIPRDDHEHVIEVLRETMFVDHKPELKGVACSGNHSSLFGDVCRCSFVWLICL